MKKRKVILLGVLMLVACSFLIGCFETSVNSSDSAANEMLNFEEIEERKGLAYEKETKVIYYMASTNAYNGYSYTYFAPYISENGKFCRYINGKIVEISETNTLN